MGSERVGSAVLELKVDDKQYKFALRGVRKDSDKTATHIRGMSQVLNVQAFVSFGRVAVAAVRSVGAAFGTLVQRGAQVEGITSSFDQLAGAIGLTREQILSTTRDATKGLITDFDMMVAGNKAMLLDLPVTAESLGTMAEAATVLGRAMKQDATKSFDDLITALGRGSPLILDNLGITVKVGEANEAYARKLGISTSALDEGQKKMAFYNAAMDAAKKKVAEIGGIHLTLADHVKRAANIVQNFVDRLGTVVNQSPVLRAGLEAVGQIFQQTFGAQQANSIGAILQIINDLAIGLTYLVQAGTTTATVMVTVWSAVKTVILAIITGVLGVGTAFSQFATGLMELSSKLPLVGHQYEGMAKSAAAMRDNMAGLTSGLADQTIEAAKAVLGQGLLHEKINAVAAANLMVRDAMVAASHEQVKMGEQAPVAAAKVVVAEDTKALAATNASQQIADAFRKLQYSMDIANAEGLDKRLIEVEAARQQEMAGFEKFRLTHVEQYAMLVADTDVKYTQIRDKIIAAYGSITVAAAKEGFSTRAQLEESARKAEELYQRMEESGLYTIEVIEAAHIAAEEAKGVSSELRAEGEMASSQAVLQGAQQIFGVLGRKHKSAAIAGAVLSTLSAIAKAYASAPFPANLVLAAGAAAVGYANVSKIRSSKEGFAKGTPGLDFANFGAASFSQLHGREAVVPQGGGHQLAGEIASAMPGERGDASAGQLARIADGIDALPRTLQRAVRDGLLLAS